MRDERRSLGPGSSTSLLSAGLLQPITSSITGDAAEDLGLAVGNAVTVVVKSTEIMLGVE